MSIIMSGIDAASAPLEVRELFACTAEKSATAMHSISALPGLRGCIVYSTCNRTELWLDADCPEPGALPEELEPGRLLCSFCGVPYEKYSSYIASLSGMEACRSLFRTASGLNSRIWGENQILGQLKNALDLAVKEKTGGTVLNKLFQYAVTAGKEIRSSVQLTENHSSVAAEMTAVLRSHIPQLEGLPCLVIGCGDMGRSAAAALAACGADVTITLGRHHHSGEDLRCMPAGCRTVAYDSRNEVMDSARIVVSATTSPHYTVKRDAVALLRPAPRLFVDLAVPRDIEPEVAEIDGSLLLTIDDIPSRTGIETRQRAEEQAEQIISRYLDTFAQQLSAWECLPEVELLAGRFAGAIEDFIRREIPEGTDVDREEIAESAGRYALKKSQALLFAFHNWYSGQQKAEELRS